VIIISELSKCKFHLNNCYALQTTSNCGLGRFSKAAQIILLLAGWSPSLIAAVSYDLLCLWSAPDTPAHIARFTVVLSSASAFEFACSLCCAILSSTQLSSPLSYEDG
jgi:hypothetical protein